MAYEILGYFSKGSDFAPATLHAMTITMAKVLCNWSRDTVLCQHFAPTSGRCGQSSPHVFSHVLQTPPGGR